MDNLSRRGLLAGAGALVAAGSLGLPTASARPVRTTALPATKRFTMSGSGGEIFRHKPLWGPTVMQSFAFDTPNNRLFTGQLRSGTPANSGDLTLSQLSLSGTVGTVLGHMYLNGFGHAVSIGAQVVGSTTYIWTETDVDTANGRGRQICRFPWKNGATLSSSSVTKWKPVAGGVLTPAVDQRYGRLGVRHSSSDGMRINVYSLAAASAGDYSTVLASFLQPTLTSGVAFQGWALYGSYCYFWEGTAYPGEPDPDKANSKLWCYDINAGKIVDSFLTLAGNSLTYREAEGMAVYGSTDATARLYFGFASGVSGDRRANLFYRNNLV